MTPLEPIKSFDDIPKPVANYTCPADVLDRLGGYIDQLNNCEKRKAEQLKTLEANSKNV